jgi:hypothetical protein
MNNRSVASLSPTLLARKGAARPAMRPQLQPLRQFQENVVPQLDDLGWNDMGAEPESPEHAVQQQAGAPAAEVVPLAFPREQASAPIVAAPVPEVVRQQETIAARIAAPRRTAKSAGRRAAFTLRLDDERHLKLRLACVTRNRSAQQIVTEALDRLLADLPEVAELAAKVHKSR